MDELEALSNRGYTEGFFRRHPPAEYQMYEQGSSLLGSEQLVGEVVDANDGWMTIDVKNRFAKGDRIMLMTPQGNHHFTLAALESLDGTGLDVAPGNGHVVRIPSVGGVHDLAFSMITRQV